MRSTHLHAVAQWARDGLDLVGSGDEEHSREVERQREEVVAEVLVLPSGRPGRSGRRAIKQSGDRQQGQSGNQAIKQSGRRAISKGGRPTTALGGGRGGTLAPDRAPLGAPTTKPSGNGEMGQWGNQAIRQWGNGAIGHLLRIEDLEERRRRVPIVRGASELVNLIEHDDAIVRATLLHRLQAIKQAIRQSGNQAIRQSGCSSHTSPPPAG